jgi:hypothetical protein
MLAILLLVALIVSDTADAACRASRSRGGNGKQAAIGRPKIIKVPKQAEHSVSCPSRPSQHCEVARSSSVAVQDDADDSRDRVVWRWRGATKSGRMEIGDPSQSTAVALCVYDSFEGHPFLVTALRVEPGAAWNQRKPGAWRYHSTGQSSAGVTRIAARTTGSGKTRFGLKAKGKRLPLPLEPATRAKLYHQDRDVFFQLVTSANATCWASRFPTAEENSTVAFVAPGSREGSAVSAGTRH